jgi:hypothetical protein
MKLRFIPVAVIALLLSSSVAFAYCDCATRAAYAPAATGYVTSYAPVSYSSYATPAVAYRPVTTGYSTYYTPATPTYTTYYAAPTSGYTTYYAAPTTSSYTTYYAPTTSYAASTPYTTYYAPTTTYSTYYEPYTSYYYPGYSTYYYGYGVPGTSVYGAPRYYVPGEPVRNTFRAVTP